MAKYLPEPSTSLSGAKIERPEPGFMETIELRLTDLINSNAKLLFRAQSVVARLHGDGCENDEGTESVVPMGALDRISMQITDLTDLANSLSYELGKLERL